MEAGEKLGQVITVAGEQFEPTVLRVLTSDNDGSPRTFELVRQDESVDISSGKEKFWVVYGPVGMAARRQ